MGDRHDSLRGDDSTRIDERALRRLLSERSGSPPPRNLSAVAQVLNAVSAPRSPGDRAELSAVAAFRELRTPQPSRRPQRTRTVLGVAMVVVLGSGVAFAASAGVRLPGERGPAATDGPADPNITVPRDPSTTDGEVPLPGPSAGPTGSAPTTGPDHRTDPGRDRRWEPLCDAYHRRPPAQRERALGQPGFRPLVEAAGGSDRVEDFCAALPGSTTSDPSTRVPESTRGGPQSDRPGGGTGGQGGQGGQGDDDAHSGGNGNGGSNDPDTGGNSGGQTGGGNSDGGQNEGGQSGGGDGGENGGDGGEDGGEDGDSGGDQDGGTSGGEDTAPAQPDPHHTGSDAHPGEFRGTDRGGRSGDGAEGSTGEASGSGRGDPAPGRDTSRDTPRGGEPSPAGAPAVTAGAPPTS